MPWHRAQSRIRRDSCLVAKLPLNVFRRNYEATLFNIVHVGLFAATSTCVPRLGLIGYGWGEMAALASYLALHVFAVRPAGRDRLSDRWPLVGRRRGGEVDPACWALAAPVPFAGLKGRPISSLYPSLERPHVRDSSFLCRPYLYDVDDLSFWVYDYDLVS